MNLLLTFFFLQRLTTALNIALSDPTATEILMESLGWEMPM